MRFGELQRICGEAHMLCARYACLEEDRSDAQRAGKTAEASKYHTEQRVIATELAGYSDVLVAMGQMLKNVK